MAGFDEQTRRRSPRRIQRSGGLQVSYEKAAKTRIERNRLKKRCKPRWSSIQSKPAAW